MQIPGIFRRITHPDDWPSHAQLIEQLAGGALKEIAIDKRYLRPDGSSVWVSMNFTLSGVPPA